MSRRLGLCLCFIAGKRRIRLHAYSACIVGEVLCITISWAQYAKWWYALRRLAQAFVMQQRERKRGGFGARLELI